MAYTELIDEPDLFGDAVRCDPYPTYRRLLDEAPIYRSDRLGAWVVSRYGDGAFLLRHPAVRHWADGVAEDDFGRTVARWMTMLDPRQHRALRHLVAPLFSRRAVDALRAELSMLADRLAEGAAEAGHIDVVNGYAEPIALAAIARVIGIPDETTEEFYRAARSLAGRLAAAVGMARTASGDGPDGAAINFLRDLLGRDGDAPAGTLLAVLSEVHRDGELEDAAEALAFLLLFLFAGHENMMNSIGNAAFALVEAPDQLALLRSRPALVRQAIDELMRFESPVQFMSISLAEPVAVGGREIGAGDAIFLCIGAANRDGAQFADPDRLDIAREHRAHLGFGAGPFTCIGAALARLQGEIAIAALARHMRRPSIDGPLRLRREPPVLRGFVSLDLVLDA
jgi:hypothetical protein